MKPFDKSKDGVIDTLLRGYVSLPKPEKACSEFDPDLVNAYIECRLTAGSRARYEVHLSECVACRKGVAVLVRLYDADNPAAALPAGAKDRPSWFSGARRVFGVLSRPQWAMALAGAIVLAISLPVLLSRNTPRSGDRAANSIGALPIPNDGPRSPDQPVATSPATSPKPESPNSSISTATPSKPGEKREIDAVATRSAGAVPTGGAAGGAGATAEQSPKAEAKSVSQTGDEVQAKSRGQLAPQTPAQAGAAPGSQVAKKESEDRQAQPEKDSAQQSADSKQDRADEPRDREKVARAEEAAPPPASNAEAVRGRAGPKRSSAKLALRDSATTEAVRPLEPQKKIGNKKFFFKDNTWTDKDFDPSKDLPVVTIIRDSNVYKEELAKRTGLKPYVERFTGTERAIIVYKGTVYKLIPQ
jgi:hypothetical protein